MMDEDFPVSLEAVEKADLGKLIVLMLRKINQMEQDIRALQRLQEPVEWREGEHG